MNMGQPSPNKQLVLDFIAMAVHGRRPREGFLTYASPQYKQHNQTIGDGLNCVIAFFEAMNQFGGGHYEIRYMIEEGDRVVTFAYLTEVPGGKPFCLLADMFRIEDGKLVEHWDVYQRVTELPFREKGELF